jgi:hypothetical protein
MEAATQDFRMVGVGARDTAGRLTGAKKIMPAGYDARKVD